MNESTKLLTLAALTGVAAFLWLTVTGKKVAASAGAAVATGAERVADLFDSTLQLIKRFEGFSAKPYPDAGGFSIGYGHFILPGENFTEISREKAHEILKADSANAVAAVKGFVKVPLTQNQFDALTSFAYNVGVTAFRNSTLVRLLNAGDYSGAANQLPRWNKSQGVVLQTLVDRRTAEKALFLA
jgi:lysozyme